MSRRRRCLYVDATMLTEHGYVPSMITEDEAGHTPMTGKGPGSAPWYWGHDLAEAKRIAAEANAEMGLSEQDVTQILASSFRAQTRRHDRRP